MLYPVELSGLSSYFSINFLTVYLKEKYPIINQPIFAKTWNANEVLACVAPCGPNIIAIIIPAANPKPSRPAIVNPKNAAYALMYLFMACILSRSIYKVNKIILF